MLKLTIIGLGVMGKNHYRILKQFKHVQIVGMCSHLDTENYPEPVFDNVDDLLSQLSVDAAIIAVPTYLHKEIAIKCIEKHIHLLIEKPVASSVAEGKEILKKAIENQVKVVVGHIERFNPVVQALKNEIKDKTIYNITITRTSPFPNRITDVGILTDLAVHDIDLIRFITGKEIINKSIYKTHNRHHKYEDNAILTFELENKIIAAIITNWLTPFKRRTISVACHDAYFEADLMSQELTEYSDYKLNNSFVTRKCFVNKGEPLVNELSSFIEYVSVGTPTVAASIEDSLITLSVIQEAVDFS